MKLRIENLMPHRPKLFAHTNLYLFSAVSALQYDNNCRLHGIGIDMQTYKGNMVVW